MNKKIVSLACVIICQMWLLLGCSAGVKPKPTISIAVVSGTICTNMKNNDTCGIMLTYNTNGVSGVALTYVPYPLGAGYTSNNSFSTTIGTCQAHNIPTQSSGTCLITIVYTTQGSFTKNANLAFTLGTGDPSNIIALSGD